jgi:DNA-directed RNA polymerase subunit RPC12/RpoP
MLRRVIFALGVVLTAAAVAGLSWSAFVALDIGVVAPAAILCFLPTLIRLAFDRHGSRYACVCCGTVAAAGVDVLEDGTRLRCSRCGGQTLVTLRRAPGT